ncbi:MAG: hypothetical protein KFH87_03700 [Bacteroidetes bacterium]|nr:hypothetical protein [Bacteroidota bacterium]
MKTLVISCLVIAMSVLTRVSAQTPFILHVEEDSCEVVSTTYVGRYPPLTPDMPWYVANSYILVDSVCRSATPETIRDSLSRLSDDSLWLGYCNFVFAHDYNPLLLHHYWWDGSYTRGDDYVTTPHLALAVLQEEYYNRFGEPDSNQWKIFDADGGIYRIHVYNVEMRSDSGYNGFEIIGGYTGHWCARGVVMDCLLGEETNFGRVEMDGIQYPVVYVNWNVWSTVPDHTSPDSELYNTIRHDFLVEGKEYLVFLDAVKITCREELQLCYWIIGASHVFEIDASGYLHGDHSIFGVTESLTYEQAKDMILGWKNALLQRRDRI